MRIYTDQITQVSNVSSPDPIIQRSISFNRQIGDCLEIRKTSTEPSRQRPAPIGKDLWT